MAEVISLMDVYGKVGYKLAEEKFDVQSPEIKKQLVDKNLKQYLIEKISKINEIPAFSDPDNEISVEDLVTQLGESIPAERHFDTLRHLTHFIINIAGEMQGWSIIWYSAEDPKFIDNPLASFDQDGKWNSITTHKDHPYVQTFRQVYGIFKEKFMVKNNNPQLTMRTNKQLGSGN